MQIAKNMTIAKAEELIALLNEHENLSLQIPTRGNHQAAGGEAAFVQAFATWASVTRPAGMATYAEGPHDTTQIDRLTRRLYGLSSVLLADKITDNQGGELTLELQQAALSRLSELQSDTPERVSRGSQVEVLCFDHLAKSYPKAFYLEDGQGSYQLRDLPAFNKFAKAMLTELAPLYTDTLPPELTEALGNTLHELFRNTEEHAREDEYGNLQEKSVRGVHARRHAISPEALVSLASQSPPLATYCERLAPPSLTNRDIQLIEISVFDAGPGMAVSLSGEPLDRLSPQKERDLVEDCFRQNVSRKSLSSAGLGLPTMLDFLRERNGFLRLRTGRLALFADLGLEDDRSFGTAPDLRPWFHDADTSARVSGTLFTILFPLDHDVA